MGSVRCKKRGHAKKYGKFTFVSKTNVFPPLPLSHGRGEGVGKIKRDEKGSSSGPTTSAHYKLNHSTK